MQAIDRNKIKKVLLGRDTDRVDLAIITPIKGAYKKFFELLNGYDSRTDCFFENALFDTNNGKRGVIVYIPQGRASQDVMFCFDKTHVLFYGYAGGMSDGLQIGSVLEVVQAIDQEEIFDLKRISDYENVIGGYAPCMLGNEAEDYQTKAKEDGCGIIEMEIAACSKASEKYNNSLSAFVVVSDIPGKIDFWTLGKEEYSIFKKKKNELINYMVDYVKNIKD